MTRLEKLRRLNYLGYKLLCGERTPEEDEEAERLERELCPEIKRRRDDNLRHLQPANRG